MVALSFYTHMYSFHGFVACGLEPELNRSCHKYIYSRSLPSRGKPQSTDMQCTIRSMLIRRPSTKYSNPPTAPSTLKSRSRYPEMSMSSIMSA